MKTIYTNQTKSFKDSLGINGNTVFKVSLLESEYGSNVLEIEFSTRLDGDSSTVVRIQGVTQSQVRSMIEILTNTLPHIEEQYQGQK